MSADLTDVVIDPCAGIEYLTRSGGWVAIDEALVPPAAIVRPAQHDWGPWSKATTKKRARWRFCRRCGARAETMPRAE